MREIFSQLLVYAHGAWRYRWYAVIVAWVIALTGWASIALIPDKYESVARVYVDTDFILKPLLTGLAVTTDTAARVSMVAHLITGRPRVERVARETGLSERAHTPAQLDALVRSLSTEINVGNADAENIYEVSYSDRDPAMAQRVVQHVLAAFVEDTLGTKRADNGSAQQFLQSQILEYGQRLKESEDRLAAFRRQHAGLLPGESGDYFAQLQTASAKLADLRARFQLASARRAELKKQLEGEAPTFGLFTGSAEGGSSEIDGQIAEYRKQLDQLLLQYTDKYPKVVAIKQAIAQLEARRAGQADGNRAPGALPLPTTGDQAAAMALDINPVYQNLRLDLSRTDVDMADLRSQIGQEQQAVNALTSRVGDVPNVEAQLTQLMRGYQVTKTQYEALLSRLDSARLSEKVEASNDQVKFRMIDPPSKPLRPSEPKRIFLATAVLLLALLAGAGLAITLDQLNPVFLSRGMLATVTGLPVLGAVTLATAKPVGTVWRRDPWRLGLTCSGLLMAYMITVATADLASRVLHRLIG